MSPTPAPPPPHPGSPPGTTRATLDASGHIAAELSTIKSVGIADLADVQSHEIVRIFGSISHRVRFVGGGELLELSANRVKGSVSHDHRLVFMPYR